MVEVLDWINFGTISAERDDLLSKYFYDASVLKSVLASKNSFLVLGRKGAAQGFIESDEYKVHDGLIRALNLREPRNANPE